MLRILDEYDWAEVFGEGADGNCVPFNPDTCCSDITDARFGREDVQHIKGICEGDSGGPSWIVWGTLKDGRFFIARGSCNYTGWDEGASNDASVAANESDLIRFGMDEDERRRFGIKLN